MIPFRIFRVPLFHKRVTCQELFCCFLQQTGSSKICLQEMWAFFSIFLTPLSPMTALFYFYSSLNFKKFWPLPIQIADVFYRQSLTSNYYPASKPTSSFEIRQSKINSCSVAGPMGQMNRRPSVWCSKYYFFSWFLAEFFAKILSIYLFIFLKKYKNKSKEFWVP